MITNDFLKTNLWNIKSRYNIIQNRHLNSNLITMNKRTLLFCVIGFLLMFSLHDDVQAQNQSSKVKVSQKEPYGEYLTDGNGMSLYLFLRDASGQSTCYNECAEEWPPL